MTHRIMVAAGASGSGKTTVTCAILQALRQRGLKLVSYKSGPDYIDPLFHSVILDTQSRNLDLFLMDEKTNIRLLWENAQGADLAVLEGVMGYYDGLAFSDQASSYHLAKVTQTPVLLVMECKGRSLTLSAEIKGLQTLRKDHGIRGVILNRVSDKMFQELKESIQKETGLAVLGYLPMMPWCQIDSRHLGLITPREIADLKAKMEALGVQAEETIDLDKILVIAKEAPELKTSPITLPRQITGKPRIAIARDEAFCFYYEDSLALLEKLGAQLVNFSPLHDLEVPAQCAGLFLGGGYPELYAKALADNISMRESIAAAILDGMPCIAECGGFLYLHTELEDAKGNIFPMAGIIQGKAYSTRKLKQFGYVTLRANHDQLLCSQGEEISAHEFHYWQSEAPGDTFVAKKPLRNRQWSCVHGNNNLYAGFPHLHFYANPQWAANFLSACQAYSMKKGKLGAKEVNYE